jgi:serine/threonine protein kinase
MMQMSCRVRSPRQDISVYHELLRGGGATHSCVRMSAEVLPRRPQSAPELNMAEEAEDTLPELKMHQGVRTKTPGVSYVKKKRVRGGPRRKSHALNDGRPARMRDSSKKKQERSTAGSTVLSKSLQFIHKSLSNTRIQDYQVMEEIGKGGFGLVYRGMNVQTGATVAVKTVGLQGVPADEIENIQQEIMLMKNLDHLNIVQYMDAMNAEGYLCIILEYMEGGAISGLLSKFSNHLPEQLCKVYILQTLRGLEYLHSQGVIHRDIKGANILTTKEGIVKLADFGVAAKLGGKDTSADSVVGTPYWMAPEIIEMKSQHSHACDIWSVGCTVLELLTGKPPYFDLQQMPAMFRIVQDDHPPFPDNISPALEDFLLQCFQKDPSMRIDANGLLRHPWLKDVSAKVKDHESSSSSSSLPSHSVTSVSEVKSKHHRNNMSSSQLTTASISSPSSSKAPDDADLSEDWDAEIEEEERLVVDVPTKSGILSSRRGSLNGFELFTGEVDDDEDPFADMSDSDGDGNNDKGSRVSPRNNHNNGSNGSKGAFGRPTRSSSTRKQFADADEDDDFGELSGGLDDVFGAGVGAGGSSKYKLSAFTTLGAPDNAFEEEDDPFEDLEFDGAANNVPKSTEDMVLKNALKKIVNVFTQDEEDLVILEACKNLSELLETESDSKVQRLFADNRDTIIPIMDMLEGDNDTTLLLHILKLVNQIIGKVGKAFQQSMSVVGLTPVIIKFADPNQVC